MPSMTFMSMASSVTSPALAAATSGSAEEFDQYKNSGILHRMSADKEEMGGATMMSEEDLMEMGGDPAFLDFDDMEGDGSRAEVDDDAAFFGWDGEVNEDAHLD